jgi:hypothetical protein
MEPGAFGIDGIFGGADDAGLVAVAPQFGHASAFTSTSAPHMGHFTCCASITGGLKHITVLSICKTIPKSLF